jgi:2-deoxy-D-gluconate 3-dehydrogenase
VTYSKDDNSILQRLFSLEGKTALITGANGGIGRALAIAFSQAGAVVGAHNRSVVKPNETASEILQKGGKAIPLYGDIASVDECQRLIASAHEALGRLDILVNCAGMNRRKPIADVTPDDFDTIVSVNLRSAFFLSQAAHPIMRAQGAGKVINIGSLTSLMGLGDIGTYGLTKAGLAQMTKTMAVEWARDNIQVNCLVPGFIDTPLTHTALWGDPKKSAWILSRTPAKRPGKTDDLLGAALLLASSASDFITGHTLVVDGGLLAGGWWDA